MDNIISIFTGEEPCIYLCSSEQEFSNNFRNDPLHAAVCQDCVSRYSVNMRRSTQVINELAKQISGYINKGELNDD